MDLIEGLIEINNTIRLIYLHFSFFRRTLSELMIITYRFYMFEPLNDEEINYMNKLSCCYL